MLRITASTIYDALKNLLTKTCSTLGSGYESGISVNSSAQIFADMVINILKMIVWIDAAVWLSIFNGVQTRFRFTFSLLKPKFSRINS